MDCLNCGKKFTKSDKYCSACGQNTDTTRMSTKHALHQFFHAFTHTDRGFFDLIPRLITKPGITAREYNEGKRKTFFSPFTFVLIIVAVSTILVSTYNIMLSPNMSAGRPEAQVVSNFTNKHFNVMVFFSIPLVAYLTSIFFKKRMNFAESLVLVSYSSGERSIFFIILVIPLILLFRQHYFLIIYSYLALYMIYYSWSCCQYLNDYKVSTFIKGSLCFILAQLALTLLIVIVITILITMNKLPQT